MIHPFMPFISEEIWQHLPHEGDTITLAAWPEYDEQLEAPDAVSEMELLDGHYPFGSEYSRGSECADE